jgi:hypothetical protein
MFGPTNNVVTKSLTAAKRASELAAARSDASKKLRGPGKHVGVPLPQKVTSTMIEAVFDDA